jgi:enamine deaminase RidA (YjgF/YER057c/UK114 family)
MHTTKLRRAIATEGVARPPYGAPPAVVAGDWVFIGATMATDWQQGIAEEWRGPEDFPFDRPPMARQAEGIYRTLERVLGEAGTAIEHIVRLDQFTPEHDQFRHYLPVRDRYLTHDRPASTALAIKDLLVPGAVMQLDGIAIVPREGFVNVGINTPAAPAPRAGYSMAVRAGDWIWCSGASPTDFKSRAAYPGGVGHTQPEEITVDPNFWYGSEIRLQTQYDLHKLKLYLEAAGSDFAHVVKAQAYLTDARDLGGFMEVWRETFGDDPPATSVQVIDKMGIGGSRVEINMIAIAKDGALRREVIETSAAPKPHLPAPQAIKAGPYLFLSGREALTERGIDPRAKPNGASPYLGSKGRDEMAVILEHTDAICRAAGGSLRDVVRMQVFTPDLREIGAALGPWQAAFPSDAPTLTVVGVSGPLPVPALALTTDLMAYIP